MKRSRVVRHLGALRRAVSTPRDAWLLARMLGWSVALPLLKSVLPLPRLVRLMRPGSTAAVRDRESEERIAALAQWVFRSRPRRARDNCLERALVTYRYLTRAGADPLLVVGMTKRTGKDRERILGHVWVTVDGMPVHDLAERLAGFDSVVAFGSDGRWLSTGRSSPSGESGEGRSRTSRLPPAGRPR